MSSSQAARPDLATVAAIGVLAYVLSIAAHEALGHGITALALGAPVRHLTNVDLEADTLRLSAWQMRLFSASGCAANIAVGAGALAWLRRGRGDGAARYFAWLLGHVSLFMAGGSPLALSFASSGDWHDFAEGLPALLAVKLLLTAAGAALSLWTFQHCRRTLGEFTGSTQPVRKRRATALTLAPYLAGSLTNSLASVLNPINPQLILMSAAAWTFGGTFWLVLAGALPGRVTADMPQNPTVPGLSRTFRGLGIAALLFLFLVLAPGFLR